MICPRCQQQKRPNSFVVDTQTNPNSFSRSKSVFHPSTILSKCCLKWELVLPLAFPFILHLKAQNLCSYRTNQTKPAKHIIIVLSHFNPLAQVSIKVKLAFGCQGRVAGDQDDRGQIVVAPCHLVTCSHGSNPAAWFFVLLQLLQLKKGLFKSFGIK